MSILFWFGVKNY